MIWSDSEIKIVKDSVISDSSPRDCYMKLLDYWQTLSPPTNRTYDSVQRKMYRMKNYSTLENSNLPVEPMSLETVVERDSSSEDLVPTPSPRSLPSFPLTEFTSRIEKIIDLQEPYLEEATAYSQMGLVASRKILSMSDIHFPIARTDLLQAIIQQHKDADVCVLNGDLFDGYAFSSYKKEKKISALVEYQSVLNFVLLCKNIFKLVVLIDGNHDIRSTRYLKDLGATDETIAVLRPNLMARISHGEELDSDGHVVKYHDMSNVHYDPRESWYAKIGKTIFAHPSTKDSGRPGATALKVSEYFSNRYDAGEVDSIVVGHTHRFYKGVIGRQLLIEQGCLSSLAMYSHEPSLKYTSTAINGYAVVYQDENGNTLFNETTPVYLGHVLPPKKTLI
jgi:predicted phosphodiesterase